MKQTRKALALAAALSIMISLSACGESADTPEETEEATTTPAASAATTTTTTSPKITTTTTTTTTLPPLPPMSTYEADYETNNDMRGWIKIDNTDIDYPVVQAEDNKYYLTHDFEQNEVKNGALFIDFKCKFTTRTRPANTIIYGHNMIANFSFAGITHYDPTYKWRAPTLEQYYAAPTVTFDTVWEEGTYKIFAAMYVNTEEEKNGLHIGDVFKYYKQRTIENEEEFYTYVTKILDRSLFYTDVDLQYGDELLTLSTCYYTMDTSSLHLDNRFVLFARRVREGEDPEVDTSVAYINPDPLYFDYWYQVNGGGTWRTRWGGRKWDTSKVKGLDEYLEKNPESGAVDPLTVPEAEE